MSDKPLEKSSILEIIIPAIVTVICTVVTILILKPVNPEMQNIRQEYKNAAKVSAEIIEMVYSHETTDTIFKKMNLCSDLKFDSLSTEYGVCFRSFIPFTKDSVIYSHMQDFYLALHDYCLRGSSENSDQLKYLQSQLLKDISKQIKQLQ